MNGKRLFLSRIAFYLSIFVVIIVLQIISIFLYIKNVDLSIVFIKNHIYQIGLVIILTFTMLYATGMVSYYRRRPKAWTSFNVLQVVWLSFLSLSVAYTVSTLFFYSTRIGRTIYLYNFILLSLFFILNIERFLKHSIKKTTSYVWLCRNITPERLKAEYGINIFNIRYSFSPEDSPENTILLYDDPKTEGKPEIIEKIIRGFTAMPIPYLLELEAGLVPLMYVKDFYHISDFTSTKYFTDGVKVIMDYLFAPILFILLFPISFLVSVIHKFESPGPIFYRQLRSGKYGEPFYLIKFRTMIKDAEKSGQKFSSKDDPRVTRIGRIMRKLRLDEVPQLINVMRGEMSLIGPRPERPEFIEEFSKKIPYYKLRLEVKPGLTGWAQVHYKYTGPDLSEQIRRLEYDLYYLKNRSVILDFIILLKTIGVVLKAEGV